MSLIDVPPQQPYVHLISALDRCGGAEVYAINIALTQKHQYNIPTEIWVVRGNWPENKLGVELCKSLGEANIPIRFFGKPHDTGMKNIIPFLRKLYQLTKTKIDNQPIRYIHSHGELPDFMLGLQLISKNRKIRTIQNEKPWPQMPFRLSYILENWLLKDRFKLQTIVSETAQTTYETTYNYPKNKLVYLNNGIAELFFAKQPNTNLRKHDNQLCIAIIGRITEQKGHIYGIRAFDLFAASHPEAQLLIIGQPQESWDAVNQEIGKAKYKDQIVHKGMLTQADILSMLNTEIDILLMPSLWEGQPLTMPEAMSQSIPVVASNVSGVDRILNEGGGILCEKANPESLCSGLQQLVSVEATWQTKKQEAYRISQRFNIRTVTKNLMNLVTGIGA